MHHRFGLVVVLSLAAGCFGNTSPRIRAPKWTPQVSADSAMEMDSDSDGLLAASELKQSPGLKAALPNLDVDGDHKLSRDELIQRLEDYAQNRTGLMEFRCLVRFKGRPLPEAKVRLIPERFIEDVVVPASGTTGADGQVALAAEDQLEPFMRPGIYRVEITSASVKIPAKYNTETTLGIAVDSTNPYTETAHFKLR